MNIVHKPMRTLVSVAVLGILAGSSAYAGGFSLYTEGSPAAIGNYAAGIAAEAADAATGWYNPAGLVFLNKQQVVVGGIGVFPDTDITGTSTFAAPPFPNYVQSFNDLDGGENALVPSFHYAQPLGENAAFGLSMVSPFGLATDWGYDSPVRYQATFTELITTNISPEIAGKLTQNFSVGAGLDLQYAQVKFNRILGVPNIFQFVLPPFNGGALDSLSYNKGHSFGVGFHAGVMASFNDNHTRVGLNYQSIMRHTFHGFSRLTGPLANVGSIFGPLPGTAIAYSDELYSNPIELPDVLTLSAYHDLNDRLALLASFVYTGWSTFDIIQLNNVAAPAISNIGNVTQVKVDAASPQGYSDAYRVALGANYKVNQALMLRVGGGYDQTPTNDLYRDVRLPDADRWALSVGAHYQAWDSVGVDVGYTHLFPAENSTINRTDALTPTTSYNVTATTSGNADLVGLQVVWTMDKGLTPPTK